MEGVTEAGYWVGTGVEEKALCQVRCLMGAEVSTRIVWRLQGPECGPL